MCLVGSGVQGAFVGQQVLLVGWRKSWAPGCNSLRIKNRANRDMTSDMTWWLGISQREDFNRILMHFSAKHPLLCRWSSHPWSHKVPICTGLAAMCCKVLSFISTFAETFLCASPYSTNNLSDNIPTPQN